MPRFAFLVHPLTGFHRRVVGVRRADWSMAVGGEGRGEPGVICNLTVEGIAEGVVVSVPLLPEPLLTDQQAALEAMVRAVEVAREALGGLDAVGLGSLLAVVAGRGGALAERVDMPVTTGAAATTWAAVENTVAVMETLGQRRVAVLGFAGTVGEGVAAALGARGYEVVAGGSGRAMERQAKKLGVELSTPEAAAGSARVVVGASTTGGILAPEALAPGTVLLDIALPPTLKPGRRPEGVQVLAGEAVALPEGWRKGFWGTIYHWLSYGHNQAYACLMEPIVLSVVGRDTPYAQGRRLKPNALEDFRRDARALSLRPRLARGWSEVRPQALLTGPAG